MSVTAIQRTDRPPSPVSLIERAVEGLVADLATNPSLVSDVRHDETKQGLRQILEAARVVLEENGQVDASAVDVRLVMILRAAVLGLEVPDEAAPAVVAALKTLERVLATALGAEQEGLASRLSQPDALQLLIEVAHDLRSPLTSILFLSETLRTGHSGEVNDQQRSQLGLIYSAALGLASLASNVIDLAREGRGLVDGEPEPYAFAELVRGVQEMVQPMADEKGVELRISVPEYDRAHGHPVALGRVLLNLTTNALKFTDHGYVEIGIRRHSASRVNFYVRDTGRGISLERREELFNPFQRRIYSAGHFFSGSGVGLSIARRAVRAMGSDLEIETAPDWGTRFSFTIDVPPSR